MARLSIAAEPILSKLTFLNSSPNPGISLVMKGEMLSIVTSLGERPVPPVTINTSTCFEENARLAALLIMVFESVTSVRPSIRCPALVASCSIMSPDLSSGFSPASCCLNLEVLQVRMNKPRDLGAPAL